MTLAHWPYRALIDDAAIFPPGEASLTDAVEQHRRYQSAEIAACVGPFVVGADSVVKLAALVDPRQFPQGLRVSVVVAQRGVSDALHSIAQLPDLVLAGLEVRLPVDATAADATAADVREVADLQRSIEGTVVFVELGRVADSPSASWQDAVATIGRSGLRLKLRTGGMSADMFPSERELALAISTAVLHGTAFKCTAGLHNAVRHRDPATGFEHHGFLNVMLATLDALSGADPSRVQARLAERRGATLAVDLRATAPARLVEARSMFLSFGSCSIEEPLADLEALGVLRLGALETA